VVLRIAKVLAAGAVLVAVGIFVAGRFSDGPLGFFSGGAFRSGELVEGPVSDWSFLHDAETIELQLLDPPRARTVWVIVHEGRAWIPCGLPGFRLWKQWPHDAMADGRALVRSGGRLYPVALVRDEDPARFVELAGLLDEKYGSPEGMGPDRLWWFRLEPRAGASSAGGPGR
jgi:hypothetical protein